MRKDIRTIYAEFNNLSMKIFFSLLNEFRNETTKIERVSNENVFQLLRSKYSCTLQERLERGAFALIDKCDSKEDQGRLRIGFSEKIKYFLREFVRKANLL